MPFRHDLTGVKEAGGFSPAPEGTYTLIVKEAKEGMSNGGDPNVMVVLEILDGEHRGKRVWHNITFIPADRPGAGFAKAWLKHIGQSHEGKVMVVPANWVGRRIEADLGIKDYEGKDGAIKKKNVILDHRSPGSKSEQPQASGQSSKAEEDDGVPF